MDSGCLSIRTLYPLRFNPFNLCQFLFWRWISSEDPSHCHKWSTRYNPAKLCLVRFFLQYAQELLSTFSTSIGEVALIPATGGVFTVDLTHSSPLPATEESPAVGSERSVMSTTRLWDRKVHGGFPGKYDRSVHHSGKTLPHPSLFFPLSISPANPTPFLGVFVLVTCLLTIFASSLKFWFNPTKCNLFFPSHYSRISSVLPFLLPTPPF